MVLGRGNDNGFDGDNHSQSRPSLPSLASTASMATDVWRRLWAVTPSRVLSLSNNIGFSLSLSLSPFCSCSMVDGDGGEVSATFYAPNVSQAASDSIHTPNFAPQRHILPSPLFHNHSHPLHSSIINTFGTSITLVVVNHHSRDWSCHPLTEEQITYAAMDAYCLVEIFNVFNSKVANTDP
ncbi:uncharacterized protein LOC110279525 [Arachis duranensis]|uniref:Uncharacterized protein LOC110279525 n=1 Tax=Arachis duranensis TaxID=130453 RepID=A0A9C6TWV6_ARADU|nr:uncharacterized protein LOC110279525 [Arachis duranensis]